MLMFPGRLLLLRTSILLSTLAGTTYSVSSPLAFCSGQSFFLDLPASGGTSGYLSWTSGVGPSLLSGPWRRSSYRGITIRSLFRG